MAAKRPEKGQTAYQIVLSTTAGLNMLDDLVIFSQHCDDPVRALGRADVVLRMLREKQRMDEPEERSDE